MSCLVLSYPAFPYLVFQGFRLVKSVFHTFSFSRKTLFLRTLDPEIPHEYLCGDSGSDSTRFKENVLSIFGIMS